MKRIILITLLPLSLLMAGSFVMTKGNPLMKIEEGSGSPTPYNNDNMTYIGCTGTYKHIKTVDTESMLENAVLNANESTKIVVADGTYTSPIRLKNNKAPVCIQAETHNKVKIQNRLQIIGDNITIDSFLFNGENGYIFNLGENTKITNNVWDDSKANRWLISRGSKGLIISNNTFKNKTNNPLNDDGMIIEVRSYIYNADGSIADPINAHIHHNYFTDISKGKTDNGYEIMFIGTYESPTSDKHNTWKSYDGVNQIDENIIVENNYVLNNGGESEIISVKSSGVTLRNNTFKNSRGSIDIRAGHNCKVHDNFILGGVNTYTNSNESAGILLYGRNHQVYSNYIENITMRYQSAIEAYNSGDRSTYYLWGSDNHNIHHNYIKDCTYGIQYGRQQPGTNLIPKNSKFVNNTIVNPGISALLFNDSTPKLDIIAVNEITRNTTYTSEPPSWDMSGIITENDVANGIVGAKW